MKHFRIAGAIALLVLCAQVSAQTINAYRYWFDDNGASAVTTPVAGGQQYTLSAVDAGALTKGYHRITVQFRDSNNEWGVPVTSMFYRNGGYLTAYQYWFDDAGTPGSVNLTPGTTANITASLDASALDLGYHRVTIRTRDALGVWSAPITSVFARTGGQQVAYQYWFDDDVNTLVETTMGATDVVDIATQLDASTLINGPHTVTLRTKDQQSGFSVPVTYAFDVAVGIEEIAGLDRVLLFPNPANDMLHVRFDAEAAADLRFDVIDASGRVVVGEEREVVAGSTLRMVGIAHLSTGTYRLRISSDAGSFSRPFTKL